MPRRPNAELVKTSKFRELEFYIMKKRHESVIYADMQVDLTNTFKFLEKHNKDKKEDEKLTLFQIFLTAVVRTITLRPKVNRFVAGRRLWQRNRIILSFVVNKEKTEESEEINAMIDSMKLDMKKIPIKKTSIFGEECLVGSLGSCFGS
ncbi:MAG: 2-oxo acid dehydrogenase subunit E2 [Candidatus Heimdallarchaeota archaeon]